MLGIAGKVDPSTMLWILQHSAGQSYATDRYGPPILDGSFDPSFTLGLAYKDLRLATHMANSLELELPMTQLTTDTYRQAADTLGADTNHLEVVRLLERTNQMRLRASSNPPCHEDTYS